MHIVVVLGCKRGLKDNRIITKQSHVYYRIKKAIQIYRNIRSDKKMVVCTGGNNEAVSMKNFMIKFGIPRSRIFTETKSTSTVENCIFTYDCLSRWLTSEPTMQQLNGLDHNTDRLDYIDCSNITIHLVTNSYHMKRSKIIFLKFLHLLEKRIPGITINFVYHPAPINNANIEKWIQIEKNIIKSKY